MYNNEEKWIQEVVEKFPVFLKSMRDSHTPGRYKYSLTGDIIPEQRSVLKIITPHCGWGLGNSVFAVKIAYMLNRLDLIDVPPTLNFIKSFQDSDGEISDPFIQRKAFLRRVVAAFRLRNFNNWNGTLTRRAETRQAFAALAALGAAPCKPYLRIPQTTEEIKSYIDNLNWRQPWGAASHINHLIFFLRYNHKFFPDMYQSADELTAFVFDYCTKFRRDDGAWYPADCNLPTYQKINGAMKMMLAYDIAGRTPGKEKELIDLALSINDKSHACNNFNVICVLYYCSQTLSGYRKVMPQELSSGVGAETLNEERGDCPVLTPGWRRRLKAYYRKDDIADFCLESLEVYRRFYYPESGGFSFLPHQANRSYYGAIVSAGVDEPDIHGTHLYLWGIVLISKILGLKLDTNLQLPVT